MQDNQKHYYAFISHSSVDEKMAKWLLRKLEGYHIPVAIQKKYHAPKRLKPIFLFQADLTGNKLRAALNGELTESQYLIVVCSPSAAKSDYVNGEVQHFINSGRCDKIIPFIVAGTPFASLKNNAEEECFPPALVALKGTDNELRGVDLRESKKQRGSKQAAVVDIVATMLGVRFDVMWDRYRKQKRKWHILTILCASILMMLVTYIIFIVNSQIFVMDSQRRSLQITQDKVVINEAKELLQAGDSYLAQLLLLEVLDHCSIADNPFNSELELLLRKAIESPTTRLQHSEIGGYDFRLSTNDKYIVGHSRSDTLYVWRCNNGELVNKFFLPYISKGYYLDQNNNEYHEQIIAFLSDSILCVSDSIVHIWNIESGRHIKDTSLSILNGNPLNIMGRGKCIDCDVNENIQIWDFDESSNRFLKLGNDGYVHVFNGDNTCIKVIPIENPIVAAFLLNGEILIFTDTYICIWSETLNSLVAKKKHGYGDNESIEIIKAFFNDSMNHLVINAVINGYTEQWLMYNLDYLESSTDDTLEPFVNHHPILVSGNGDVYIYDVGERPEDIDYIISYKLRNDIIERCFQLDYPYVYDTAAQMTYVYLWDEKWKNINEEEQYIIDSEDSIVLFIDAFTMNKVDKQKKYVGNLLGISSNKVFIITQEHDSLFLYKGNKLVRVIECKDVPPIQKAEICSNGKYLLTEHYFIDDTVPEVKTLHSLWNISNSDIIWSKKDFFSTWTFSIDGNMIFSSNGEIYDIKNRKVDFLCKDIFSYDTDQIYVIPDGKHIALWNDMEASVWDISTNKLVWKSTLGREKYPICDIKSDHTSTYLLVTTRYNTSIYDIASGQYVASRGYENGIIGDHFCSFYSPNDESIFILTIKGLYVWDFEPLKVLQEKARNYLNGRTLSKEERVKYFRNQ